MSESPQDNKLFPRVDTNSKVMTAPMKTPCYIDYITAAVDVATAFTIPVTVPAPVPFSKKRNMLTSSSAAPKKKRIRIRIPPPKICKACKRLLRRTNLIIAKPSVPTCSDIECFLNKVYNPVQVAPNDPCHFDDCKITPSCYVINSEYFFSCTEHLYTGLEPYCQHTGCVSKPTHAPSSLTMPNHCTFHADDSDTLVHTIKPKCKGRYCRQYAEFGDAYMSAEHCIDHATKDQSVHRGYQCCVRGCVDYGNEIIKLASSDRQPLRLCRKHTPRLLHVPIPANYKRNKKSYFIFILILLIVLKFDQLGRSM